MTDSDKLTIKKYLEILKNAEPLKLVPSPNYRFSRDESQIGLTIVPACTADIRFAVGTYSLQLPKFSLSEKEKMLPKTWKNHLSKEEKDNKKDNKKDKDYQKKILSTKPVNQGYCGSCFAVAIATTISDNFLFKYDLDYNPNLSPMYILSCLSNDSTANNKCAGGNPSMVVDLIIQNGIATNCCQNYYEICNNSQYCGGPGLKHMEALGITIDQKNSMIPKCGHCTDDIPKLWTIKSKIISYDIPSIKIHLMKYGSAVGGFLVYNNFVRDISKGKFTLTKGIYIHTVNYTSDSYDVTKLLGGHAICIVGWGEETITFTDFQGNAYENIKIEYWICRNSWSENWGLDGYFKYAMYKKMLPDPKTQNTLPDIQSGVAFETNNGNSLGGILLIEPDKYDVDVKEGNILLNKVQCDTEYTCKPIKHMDDKPIDNKKDDLSNKKIVYVDRLSTFSKWMLALCFFILMIILFFHIFGMGKKTKGRKRKSHRK